MVGDQWLRCPYTCQ
uniref:Uncharacterized protein n=1 Tax=Anguilla anguilla TaxID=7936 RepID=A0A0E9QSX5_ANGAN